MRDVDELEVGELLDIITTYNNINDDSTESKVRQATQSDYDNF